MNEWKEKRHTTEWRHCFPLSIFLRPTLSLVQIPCNTYGSQYGRGAVLTRRSPFRRSRPPLESFPTGRIASSACGGQVERETQPQPGFLWPLSLSGSLRRLSRCPTHRCCCRTLTEITLPSVGPPLALIKEGSAAASVASRRVRALFLDRRPRHTRYMCTSVKWMWQS